MATDSYATVKDSLLEEETDSPNLNSSHSDTSAEIRSELEKIEPVEAPEPIEDLIAANAEQLRQDVEDRECYISWLVKKLRVYETILVFPIDWDALGNAPEELQTRLREIENSLDETLRFAEIENSLERA